MADEEIQFEAQASEKDILLGQRIISAASRHDVPALQVALQEGSANVRDPASGTTPLHAATEAATAQNEEKALATVVLLLKNGAIWNDLNKKDETAGCIALRVGATKIYEEMVQAGVRAELLFSRMKALGLANDENEAADQDKASVTQQDAAQMEDVSLDNHAYLQSRLRFKEDILLDISDNAVMMSWETEIMIRHAETLLPTPGLRVANFGHGMGIVDRAIQARNPKEHHIIEAHPQVLTRLKEQGWHDKPGVVIHAGRWQEVVPKLAEQGVVFDAMYYDTFAEDYDALKLLFTEHVINLLDEHGRFGWYNGLGADRQICYDVYTRVAEMDLYAAGFDTTWEDIRVPEGLHDPKTWEGTRRPYWSIDVYRLPVNTFISSNEHG